MTAKSANSLAKIITCLAATQLKPYVWQAGVAIRYGMARVYGTAQNPFGCKFDEKLRYNIFSKDGTALGKNVVPFIEAVPWTKKNAGM